jgi:hypothetical protein
MRAKPEDTDVCNFRTGNLFKLLESALQLDFEDGTKLYLGQLKRSFSVAFMTGLTTWLATLRRCTN